MNGKGLTVLAKKRDTYWMLALVGGLVAGLLAVVIMQPLTAVTQTPQVAKADRQTAPKPVIVGGFEAAAHLLNQPTVRKLSDAFNRIGYNLDRILERRGSVPRLFTASLPADIGQVREVKLRKAVFLMTVLPHVLRINEEILADRRRLWRLRHDRELGRKLRAEDRLWLAVQTERYRTKAGDLDALMARMDVIPPSLALAQAAVESGWGTSRFAREGNALFGQWTWTGKGVTPLQREEGKTHKIKAFDSIEGSVRDYMRNLNTHRAYREFRKQRAAIRRDGAPLDGGKLAGTMLRYSERGQAYVDSLTTIISANNLRHLDDVRLDVPAVPQPAI